MKTYYVLVESAFLNKSRRYEKLGYVKIDLKQYIGDFREYCHACAISIAGREFTIGSYTVGKITTKPLKKIRILN